MRARLLVVLTFAAALAPACKRTKPKAGQADPSPAHLKVEDGPVFPPLKAADITRLVIDRPGAAEVILERSGDHWALKAPIRDTADDRAIFYALQELDRMEWEKAPLPDAPATAAARGATDADLLTIQITQNGVELPRLRLGKKGVARAGDRRGLYEVYRINYFTFSREVRFWRDRTVLRIPPDDITAVEVRDGVGAAITVSRGGSDDAPTFAITAKSGIEGTLNPEVAQQAFRHLADLEAEDVSDTSPADAGLVPPRLHLVVRSKNGTRDLQIGAQLPDGSVYVRVGDGQRVLRLSKSTAALVARAPAAWLR